MDRVVAIYFRNNKLYLQPDVYPVTLRGKFYDVSPLGGDDIFLCDPVETDLAAIIDTALDKSGTKVFQDKDEIDHSRKAQVNPLLKMVKVRSYRQFQKGTGLCCVVKTDTKIILELMFPEKKNRGWQGTRDGVTEMPLSAGYQMIVARAALAHLLNPANRYPEE
ncbi:MAG: hypothetical protein KME04_17020 [Pleurocapsa minor GSE-CHR-MK-17-07R]|jgi:hypothetical protein|nr:hypothetical protein [Pleurocapsa minor GSE-CHR-MK 17-07R]